MVISRQFSFQLFLIRKRSVLEADQRSDDLWLGRISGADEGVHSGASGISRTRTRKVQSVGGGHKRKPAGFRSLVSREFAYTALALYLRHHEAAVLLVKRCAVSGNVSENQGASAL